MSVAAATRLFVSSCVLLYVTAAHAQENPQISATADTLNNKADYSLFNPTPPDSLRELSTDRPDKTESAYTVDAGHFQIELDFVTYTRDHEKTSVGDRRVETLNISPINLKLGVTNDTDVQLVFDTYVSQRVIDAISGTREQTDGVGNVTIRLKHNFWGNDGGATAFALMPFVTLPTSNNGLGADKMEGGLIAPLAIALPGQFALGLQTEIDLVRNVGDTGYTARFVNSATISRDLTNRLGIYFELFTETARDALLIATLDSGLTYAIDRDTRIDMGFNLGLTKAADDVDIFFGLSRRF